MRGERAKVSESGISLALLVIFLVVALFSGAEIWLTSLSAAGSGPDQCDHTLQWNGAAVAFQVSNIALPVP